MTELGEVVAVLEKQHLDQAIEGEEAADKEVQLVFRPAGEILRLAKDRLVKGQYMMPSQITSTATLTRKFASERHLAGQGVASEAAGGVRNISRTSAWSDQPPVGACHSVANRSGRATGPGSLKATGPGRLGDQADDERRPPSPCRGRRRPWKYAMYWNGSQVKMSDQGFWKQVEREHLAGDEEVQGHHDI